MASVNWDALGGELLDDVLSTADEGPDFGDRYEVREVLGQGGQGTVYQAWDRSLEREVAIKCLRDPGRNQRPLLDEARLLSRLAHPAIPQIYDRGSSPNGGAYVVMQYIAGQRLDRRLRSGDLGLAARLHLFHGVAGAVAHAHSRGILHRDLKPENVMVTAGGEPYLVDWGLAANGGPRAICGSPYFAAPEQLDGQPADPRADVYALGVLLYFTLSGHLPYGRAVHSFQEFQRQRAALSRVPLRQRDPSLSPALQRMCEIAMAAQPAARYQRVDDLMADLAHIEAGRPLARDLPRLPWRVIAAVVATVLALGGGFLLGRGTAPESGSEPTPARSIWLTQPGSGGGGRSDAFDGLLQVEPTTGRADEQQEAAVATESAGPASEPGSSSQPSSAVEAAASESSPAVSPDAGEPRPEAPPLVLSDPLAELQALLPTLPQGDEAAPEAASGFGFESLLPPLPGSGEGDARGGSDTGEP